MKKEYCQKTNKGHLTKAQKKTRHGTEQTHVPANSNNNTAPEPFDLTESHNCKYHPYRIKLQLIVKLCTLRTL